MMSAGYFFGACRGARLSSSIVVSSPQTWARSPDRGAALYPAFRPTIVAIKCGDAPDPI
jgi:hypothetical protein